MKNKTKFSIVPFIIIILIIGLVRQCHTRDWLNQSKDPDPTTKPNQELNKKLLKKNEKKN